MLAILFFLVSFASVGAAIFTPALPAIQEAFHVSVGTVQSMVTSYLIGYAFGQLPYGPLANGIGRKKTLYVGLIIAALGALLSILSSHLHSFTLLVIAQFIQALGGCVGMKISLTMIADLYEHDKATNMIAKILIAFAILPGFAIAIGGALTDSFGWLSCYYFLFFFTLVLIGFTIFLPETAKTIDRGALHPKAMIEGYVANWKNRKILISGIILGCGSSIVYIFQTKAPFIGIHLLHLTPKFFGLYSIVPRLGMFVGCLLTSVSAGKFLIQRVSQIGSLMALFCGIVQFIFFLVFPIHIFSLFFITALIYLFQAVVYTNINSFALSHAQNKAIASALLNFLSVGISVISVFMIEMIFPESSVMLPFFILIFLCLMFFLCLKLWKEKSA